MGTAHSLSPTVLGETLDECSDALEHGSDKDGPTTAPFLSDPWNNRDGENGSEVVRGAD